MRILENYSKRYEKKKWEYLKITVRDTRRRMRILENNSKRYTVQFEWRSSKIKVWFMTDDKERKGSHKYRDTIRETILRIAKWDTRSTEVQSERNTQL